MSKGAHARFILNENLEFQQKKLKSPVKDWEEGMRMRIQEKIDELQEADEILKAWQQGRIVIAPEIHGNLTPGKETP